MSKILKSGDIKLSEIYYMDFNINENDADDETADEEKEKNKIYYEEKIKIILDEAKKQAGEIINKAKYNASSIKCDAYEKSYKEGLEKGHEEGYKSGYEAGYDEGLKKAEQIIGEAGSVKKQVESERADALGNLEADIISLVHRCVEKIIGEVKTQERIAFTVKAALDDLKIRDSFTVRLSHEDYIIMQNRIREEKIDLKYRFTDDIALKKGDIIIDTPSGEIDVGCDSQLNKLRNELRGLLLNEN